MIDHRTFVTTQQDGISLFDFEARANFTRQRMQVFINEHLTADQIITITEAWNPRGTVAITVWYETQQQELLPGGTQINAAPTPHSGNAKRRRPERAR